MVRIIALFFHMDLKCPNVKSCQRTIHFHDMENHLIIDLSVQVITLKYNLNYRHNSNMIKTGEKWEKKKNDDVKPRPLHHIPLTSLILAWRACLWCASLPSSPPSSSEMGHTPDRTFTCFFSNCTPLTPAHHPYLFLPSAVMLSTYGVPLNSSHYHVPFHRISCMALCMNTSRSRPLSFHIDTEKNCPSLVPWELAEVDTGLGSAWYTLEIFCWSARSGFHVVISVFLGRLKSPIQHLSGV